jgi:hypothetical protein
VYDFDCHAIYTTWNAHDKTANDKIIDRAQTGTRPRNDEYCAYAAMRGRRYCEHAAGQGGQPGSGGRRAAPAGCRHAPPPPGDGRVDVHIEVIWGGMTNVRAPVAVIHGYECLPLAEGQKVTITVHPTRA